MSDVNDWNAKVIEEFRANDGKLSGQFAGLPLLLLHTTGARSGKERVNPMTFLKDEGHTYVFASKAGADSHPDWYYNLVANPRVRVEIGSLTFEATAAPVTGSERDRIYSIQAEGFPNFKEYQEKTLRVIPVVQLVAD